jgi:hypothetical protein
MAPSDYWLARLVALVTVVTTGIAGTTIGVAPFFAGLSAQLLTCTWLGVMTGGMSVSVLHFFAAHCNSSSRLQELAGQSQYAVYLLQTIVIPGVMFTLLPILRGAGYVVEFGFFFDTFGSSSELPQWVIICCWLYTVMLVTAISWPLGHFFRKLPLVREVL